MKHFQSIKTKLSSLAEAAGLSQMAKSFNEVANEVSSRTREGLAQAKTRLKDEASRMFKPLKESYSQGYDAGKQWTKARLDGLLGRQAMHTGRLAGEAAADGFMDQIIFKLKRLVKMFVSQIKSSLSQWLVKPAYQSYHQAQKSHAQAQKAAGKSAWSIWKGEKKWTESIGDALKYLASTVFNFLMQPIWNLTVKATAATKIQAAARKLNAVKAFNLQKEQKACVNDEAIAKALDAAENQPIGPKI